MSPAVRNAIQNAEAINPPVDIRNFVETGWSALPEYVKKPHVIKIHHSQPVFGNYRVYNTEYSVQVGTGTDCGEGEQGITSEGESNFDVPTVCLL